MSGSDAKFLRRFMLWAGITNPGLQRQRREAWERMSHKERGRTRKQIEAAMAADPTMPAPSLPRGYTWSPETLERLAVTK